jgi:glutathione S-transferase
MRDLAVKSIGGPTTDSGNSLQRRYKEKFSAMLAFMDGRLANVPWLAGEEFSLADIMVVCCLTTMRCFHQYELGDYKNILSYLKRVSQREGYRRAKEKGDPELDIALLAGAASPPLYEGLMPIAERAD